MTFNEIKRALCSSPDLAKLDDTALAYLLWRGEEQLINASEVVYAEGTKLDDTFCLLLEGTMQVEKACSLVGEIRATQIFGEMAYFSPRHERCATVRVSSPHASILRMQLTLAEMKSPMFAALKRFLGMQAWDRFVAAYEAVPLSVAQQLFRRPHLRKPGTDTKRARL